MVRVVTMWAVAVASASASAASTSIVELSPAAATTIAAQRGMAVDHRLKLRTRRRTRPLAARCIRVAESSRRPATQATRVYTVALGRLHTGSALTLTRALALPAAIVLSAGARVEAAEIRVKISTDKAAGGAVDGVGARAARKAAVDAHEAHR